MKGAYQPRHNVHHGITVAQDGYGVTFASPDVYTHEIRPAAPLARESTQTVILSALYRKVDELGLKGGSIGFSRIEAGMPRRWQLRYSLMPWKSAVDPVVEERKGWEASTPMVGRLVEAGGGSVKLDKPVSMLSVDRPGIMAYALKASEWNDGFILKLREFAGKPATAVVASDALRLSGAVPVDLVERRAGSGVDSSRGTVRVRMGAHELKNIRLRIEPRRPAGSGKR
jgi:alpha-mannosidase